MTSLSQRGGLLDWEGGPTASMRTSKRYSMGQAIKEGDEEEEEEELDDISKSESFPCEELLLEIST
jgi:hypothetical protein